MLLQQEVKLKFFLYIYTHYEKKSFEYVEKLRSEQINILFIAELSATLLVLIFF